MRKTLIITGASSGIGLATASLFKEKNYRVLNLSRRPCPISEVENITIDLRSLDQLKELTKKLSSLFKEKEEITLIHNASPYRQDNLENFQDKEMKEAFDIGIIAPSILNKALLPHMAEGSSLLFIGSTLSEKAVPGCMTYVTLKHALVGLMRSCTQDIAALSKRIHTACICPGFTETNMLSQHLDSTIIDKIVKNKVAFKRLIMAEEIAKLCLFCSENPVINGSVLHGNLGQIES